MKSLAWSSPTFTFGSLVSPKVFSWITAPFHSSATLNLSRFPLTFVSLLSCLFRSLLEISSAPRMTRSSCLRSKPCRFGGSGPNVLKMQPERIASWPVRRRTKQDTESFCPRQAFFCLTLDPTLWQPKSLSTKGELTLQTPSPGPPPHVHPLAKNLPYGPVFFIPQRSRCPLGAPRLHSRLF